MSNIEQGKHSTPNQFTGGCACEAIRYECSASPLGMVNCHCRDCQRAGGSGHSPTVVVAKANFTVTRGTPRFHETRLANGNVARRAFCADCGSPLFASSSGRAAYLGIRAGSLDDPSWFRPDREVWTDSAHAWDLLHPNTIKIAQNPLRRSSQ